MDAEKLKQVSLAAAVAALESQRNAALARVVALESRVAVLSEQLREAEAQLSTVTATEGSLSDEG